MKLLGTQLQSRGSNQSSKPMSKQCHNQTAGNVKEFGIPGMPPASLALLTNSLTVLAGLTRKAVALF